MRALLNTYRMQLPLVLIIDDRYAPFPYDLSAKPDCTYVVLGFYHIARAWGEWTRLTFSLYVADRRGVSRTPAGEQRQLRGSVEVCIQMV